MMHVPTAPTALPHAHHETPPTGGRLVTTTGRALPLLGTVIAAEAEGGVARVTLEQRFRNPYAEPLAVTYSLPLPADGAVSGFTFTVGARRIKGEIDRKRAARERYEQALSEGKSAALLEQDRSSLFTQEIGNIPPGAEVIVEIAIDQRLRWIDEGSWEWRFPTVVAPRYLGEPGRVPDADRVAQDVADGPLPARFLLGCTVRDRLADGRRPESPSHAIDTVSTEGGTRVELRQRSGARLDRDIVVRWAVGTPKVGVSLATCRTEGGAVSGSSFGLITVVPPSVRGAYRPVARDLIVLIDTSGSMGGEPLAQAARVVSAIIETLGEEDQIELIEFGSAPRRWRSRPEKATARARQDAIAWVRALRASGATEMRTAIVEALSTVRPGAQRQVVLVTDGQIGFEAQVVEAILNRLPAASRLHTVGVGSAVNRSLTGPAARAGHGVEVVIGLGEDPERAAARVVARTSAPLLVDLSISGSALVDLVPTRLPDLFAGAPALIAAALRPEGGEILVRGRTLSGAWEQRVRVPALSEGTGNAGLAALFAREAVEDLEMVLAAGGSAREIDPEIERLGITYQISTRLTSWVAVSDDPTVDPGDPLRRERMPHELPYGMSAEGVGLRAAVAPVLFAAPSQAVSAGAAFAPGAPVPMGKPAAAAAPIRADLSDDSDESEERGIFSMVRDFFFGDEKADEADGAPAPRDEAPAKEMKKKEAAPAPVLKGAISGPAAPAPAAVSAPAAQRPGSLRGRVTLHRAGLLVIEIPVAGTPLVWAPAAQAMVTLATGHTFTAALDAGRSTRGGTVAVGAAVRLALTLPAGEPLDTVRSVAIQLGGVIVTIDV